MTTLGRLRQLSADRYVLMLNSFSFYSSQMAVELDVFVGNTTIMDEEVYQLWLDGYTGMIMNP